MREQRSPNERATSAPLLKPAGISCKSLTSVHGPDVDALKLAEGRPLLEP
jgi:hypothetical protein